MNTRHCFFIVSSVIFVFIIGCGLDNHRAFYLFAVFVPLFILGLHDIWQKKSNVLRNYPIIGHLRYMLLKIRPQIHQYFVESETESAPFSREQRLLVSERSRLVNDNIPFGTLRDVYQEGYEWFSHSMRPQKISDHEMKVAVGGDDCLKPYVASRLNVSAMSFGALGKKAVLALNLGAKLGGFYQNTGEGGLTPYHLKNRGDVVMQIGTGYFGCREKKSGTFSEELFIEKSTLDQVKMIEIKISQGAKPAHGGVLPAIKVTEEIATIRNVESGVDCVSPPSHSAFRTPIEMLEFIAKLRKLSGGKPVGFKLCIGIHQEFMNICKAMLQTGILPDFITVDGAEGGTGAAPVEFTNNIGVPLNEGLIFVHNCLTGIGVRDKIKIIAAGKVISGFDLAKKLALGADICNSARGMMFSLGCIQSRRCHNNTCPTGIATQDNKLMYGLDVEGKAVRVKNYHHQTLHNFREVLGAAGLTSPDDLLPQHIWRRLNQSEGVENYAKLYEYLDVGVLLGDNVEWAHAEEWSKASAETFVALV